MSMKKRLERLGLLGKSETETLKRFSEIDQESKKRNEAWHKRRAELLKAQGKELPTPQENEMSSEDRLRHLNLLHLKDKPEELRKALEEGIREYKEQAGMSPCSVRPDGRTWDEANAEYRRQSGQMTEQDKRDDEVMKRWREELNEPQPSRNYLADFLSFVRSPWQTAGGKEASDGGWLFRAVTYPMVVCRILAICVGYLLFGLGMLVLVPAMLLLDLLQGR